MPARKLFLLVLRVPNPKCQDDIGILAFKEREGFRNKG
jgi:hypothetical protein